MAKTGFRGVGWILGIATVLPGCYMVTSAVAAERGRVEAVNRAIVEARRDIRNLETEFETRANYAQLEQYNGDVLALAAPRPEQFVSGDANLATLRPFGGVQQAALLVPAGSPEPMMQPAAAVAAVAAPAPVLAAPTAVETTASSVNGAVASGKAQAVAMLERKLLSDSTIGDLVSGARAEKVRMR